MLKGYDISQYQTTTPSLAGFSFIVLRASIAGDKDARYDQHYANARKAGVVTMAYHFGFPADHTPLADQVSLFLSVARDADFLWLDQEQTGFSDAQAQQFIDLVRKTRPCGLYHSASGFGGVNADAKWVADWRATSVSAGYPMTADGTKEFPAWDLWQYNGAGTDNLDNDYANPDRPLAGLLRKGYVTQGQFDATYAELRTAQAQVTQLTADKAALESTVAWQEQLIAGLQTDLAAAPAKERERIALAEADRIRGL